MDLPRVCTTGVERLTDRARHSLYLRLVRPLYLQRDVRHLALLTVLATSLVAVACTPHAYTPSARPLPLSTAQAPARGESDVQLDGNATGEVLGPGIFGGNVRYRRGVRDDLAVVGDLGLLRVDGDNHGQNPYAGTARVGVQVHAPANDDLHAAAFAGVGGGFAPTAGGYASADVGGMLTGTHRYVRPIFLLDLYASEPLGEKPFIANQDNLGTSDSMRTVELPRTVGVQGLLGFDLGRRDRSVMLGLAIAQLHTFANDVQEARSQTFFGLGGGFRFGAI